MTTGVRRGELCALRWKHLDLETGVLTPTARQGSGGGATVHIPQVKSGQPLLRRDGLMAVAVVSYALDEETVVRFEIEPSAGFRPAGPDEIAGRIREAVAPAVEGARAVLEKVKEAAPDEIEVKFGIKVSGTANWLVAKAATEGNFEITLTWTSLPAAATSR